MPTEAQLRQLFEDIDVDESGLLDRGEVADLAESLGCPLSTTELDEAMAEMDEDQSGEVDFDEFQSWFEKMEKVEQQDGGSKWASALKGKLEDYQGKVFCKKPCYGGLSDKCPLAIFAAVSGQVCDANGHP